MNQTIN